MKISLDISDQAGEQLGKLAGMQGVTAESVAASVLERALNSDIYGEELQLLDMKQAANSLADRIDLYRRERTLPAHGV